MVKKVLFAAEKKAALDVVKDRLNKAKIGNFCLELHSNKTNKYQLIRDLKNEIEANARVSQNTSLYDDLLTIYQRKNRELNTYDEYF